MDGLNVLKHVRESSLTPIIVLSARGGEMDKVEALNMGANDYVTKPFGSEEFLARVRTALRVASHRSENGMFPGRKFEMEGLAIDYDARSVSVGGYVLHRQSITLWHYCQSMLERCLPMIL